MQPILNKPCKEKPILFSAPMVRAILDGSKTQTRRVVKPQPQPNGGAGLVAIKPYCTPAWDWNWVIAATGHGTGDPFPCPYGKPGDRLWVREAWAVKRSEPCLEHEREYQELGFPVIRYLADGQEIRYQGNRSTGEGIYRGLVEKGRPSIHMPRWASRITLEITGVRVERLQDISQKDAMAEGAPPSHPSIDAVSMEYGYPDFSRSWYAQLWDSINGPESWKANPWVWCVSFKRVSQ